MTFLRQWLLGIVACALLVSLCELFTPSGAMRRSMHFTGGLILMLAFLQPVTSIDLGELTLDLGEYRAAVAQAKLELSGEREDALRDGIAERTGAYIEDKAAQLGRPVRALVETEDTDGAPLPVRVTLWGAENAALSDWIETQLGIAKENQTWKEAG